MVDLSSDDTSCFAYDHDVDSDLCSCGHSDAHHESGLGGCWRCAFIHVSTDPLPAVGVTAPKPTCTKCGAPLSACITCGEPAGCGEAWCDLHGPEDDDSLDNAPSASGPNEADPHCVWPNGVCTCGEPEGHTAPYSPEVER